MCRAYVTRGPLDGTAAVDGDCLSLARQHQLGPLVWTVLRRVRAPDDVVALALRRDVYHFAARHARLTRLLGDLLPALAARGVPLIALKGAILAERYYDRAADRPMRDVDLLVRPADALLVAAVARERGLDRYQDRHSLEFDLEFGSAFVLTRHPGDDRKPSLDVHWDLFDGWRPRRAAARWLDQAWARAEPARVAGHAVLAFRREDMLLHLASHLALHHAFTGLLWYCDIALVLTRDRDLLDWDRVVADAETLGLRGLLSVVFDALESVLGVTPPAEIRRSLHGRGPRRGVARRLALPRAARLTPINHLEHVMPLLLIERGRHSLEALAQSLIPSRRWVELRYGVPWPRAYARHGTNALGLAARTLGGTRRR